MNSRNRDPVFTSKLPYSLKPFFWDHDFDTLRWEDDREFIIGRILTSGDWDALTWLRSCVGDCALREWFERHKGGGVSPPKLRFWELILELPHRQVSTWIDAERRKIWEKRANP